MLTYLLDPLFFLTDFGDPELVVPVELLRWSPLEVLEESFGSLLVVDWCVFGYSRSVILWWYSGGPVVVLWDFCWSIQKCSQGAL